MLVNQQSPGNYLIQMTPEEEQHFQIVALNSTSPFICGVESCLAYILTWTEQHWHNTVKEPLIDNPPKHPWSNQNGLVSS